MIRIDINNSYIAYAFKAAYEQLYEPAQREYDFANNREVHDYWIGRILELLEAEHHFTIIRDDGNMAEALEFENESDLIVFRLKYV